MAVSKAQIDRVQVKCKCGCKETFLAFPVYKDGGGGLRIPEYKRGHHPNCRKVQFAKNTLPWNTGLSASEGHATVSTLGKRGRDHWNFNPDMHVDWFAKDFDFRAYALKFGVKPRSKGGNKAYAKFRLAILKRDNFCCVDCGFAAEDFSESCVLNVHHVVPIKKDRSRMFDPSNVLTLCVLCHAKHHSAKKKRLSEAEPSSRIP